MPFGSNGTSDWEFQSSHDDPPEELYALGDGAVGRSRVRLEAALGGGGLDQFVHLASRTATVRVFAA
jgi:hypothetical protein